MPKLPAGPRHPKTPPPPMVPPGFDDYWRARRPKRPWPVGEDPPWANEPYPPTVFEAARLCPGRAVRNAIFGLIAGWLSGTLAALFFKVVVGVDVVSVVEIVFLVVVTPVFWLWVTSGEVRGRFVITNDDGD